MKWQDFDNFLKNSKVWFEPSPFQNRNARMQKDHNWSLFYNLLGGLYGTFGDLLSSVTNKFDNYDQRFDDQLKANTDINEVVDARRSNVTDKEYNTLGKHIDGLEEDFNTGLNSVDNNKTYGGGGYMRESTLLKEPLELTPYEVVKDTANLAEGDLLTQQNVYRMYNALTVEQIYALYDDLVDQDRVTRHVAEWGKTADLPLKWYHFEPETRFVVPADDDGESNFDEYNRLNGSKPLLFITSGVHGNEKSNVWALYLTIKGIANGDTELDRYIRRNYEIVVLPCVNPYGLENNQRHNENDVDVNRNFPYTWDKDDNQWKGTAPFSEQSSQFVKAIRDKFLVQDDLSYKQGILFIDSHDFDFRNYDDDRIMWTGATNYDTRSSLLKTGGLVKDKITSLYPDLVTGAEQNFFALLGSGNGYGATLNAWNNSSGIKSISMESPDYLTPLGVTNRYSIQSSTISYILVRDFILQSTLDLSGKPAPDITVGFGNAMSTVNDSLLDILHNIPSGKSITIGVYSTSSNLAKEMPKRPNGKNYLGVLKATKSDASTTNSGTIEYVTTGFNTTHKFFSSFNADSVRDWQEVQPNMLFTTFTSLDLASDTASLLDVFNRLPNGGTADLYVRPGIDMHDDLPNDITNYAKIRISKNTDKTGFVELFSFHNINRMYVMNISQGAKTDWTDYTRGTYLTTFSSFGGDLEKETITSVFNKLEIGQMADLYITPATNIKKQLPARFNTDYGSVQIRKLSDQMGRIEAMTSGEDGRRTFTNVINSNGLGTWFELNDVPATKSLSVQTMSLESDQTIAGVKNFSESPTVNGNKVLDERSGIGTTEPIMSGNYGLRVTSDGFQKTTDGGSTWTTANI